MYETGLSYDLAGMRCPTCGTENVPDSRFCGACGAKLTPAESRVAPTAKIPDDAPFPAHYGSSQPSPFAPSYQSGPASIPPSNHASGPASIPPNSYQAPNYNPGPASIPPNTYQSPAYQAPASIPPTSQKPPSVPPQTYGRVQPAPAREPSLSMPAIRRPRWGLIIFILLLDLGLAAAGAVMLQKGLAKPVVEAVPATGSGSSGSRGSGSAAAASPVKAAVAQPDVAASIAAVAATDKATDKLADNAEPPVEVKKAVVKAKPTGGAPQDPYEVTNNLHAEVELAAARSKDDFNQCLTVATTPDHPVHGRIDISFRIEVDGRVDTLKIGQNTTHDDHLAACLEAAISRWAFASHPAQASDFVRPFIY